MSKLPKNSIASGLAATLAVLTLATPAIATEIFSTEIFQLAEVTSNIPATLSDGIHLYGESANAGEIGKSYTIFEVEDGRVTGAFYQPHSSFDCFRGEMQRGQLLLSITDSYSGDTFPYAIAIKDAALLASVDNISNQKAGLEGFHPLEEISDRDREILQVCQAQ